MKQVEGKCLLSCVRPPPSSLNRAYDVTGEMISHPSLPLNLVPACFDIFSKLATNERDFLRVVVEIVQELREDANVAGITKAAGSSLLGLSLSQTEFWQVRAKIRMMKMLRRKLRLL